MASRTARIGGLLGLALAIGSVTAVAASAPSSDPAPSYITVGDIVREVVTVDASSITLRETYFVPQAPRGRGRPVNPNANKKTGLQNKDTTYTFAADATARIQHLPPKKEGYNPDEFAKLKGNPNLPGFKAEIADLKPGQTVKAHVVRAKDSKDELVRWALILSEKPANAPAPTTRNPKAKN